jgi:hypothetical protein
MKCWGSAENGIVFLFQFVEYGFQDDAQFLIRQGAIRCPENQIIREQGVRPLLEYH